MAHQRWGMILCSNRNIWIGNDLFDMNGDAPTRFSLSKALAAGFVQERFVFPRSIFSRMRHNWCHSVTISTQRPFYLFMLAKLVCCCSVQWCLHNSFYSPFFIVIHSWHFLVEIHWSCASRPDAPTLGFLVDLSGVRRYIASTAVSHSSSKFYFGSKVFKM